MMVIDVLQLIFAYLLDLVHSMLNAVVLMFLALNVLVK